MKFIIKFFPEITIKSKPVRKRLVKQLRDNVRRLLLPLDPDIHIERVWDRITLETRLSDPERLQAMITTLENTPGIAYFLEVEEHPFQDIDDCFQKALAIYGDLVAGKQFRVRCKRVGQHDFSSLDVERHIGRRLLEDTDAAGVDLKNPEVTVSLEIRQDRLFIINQRYKGLGGYPLGGLDPVLSLISGGFDSTVSSYFTMKRGMRTHFCFFNLGGREHEIGVKEVALYLWMKYGASHRVKFVTVPFEPVVAEILKNVANPQMGVVLKRMMLRAASRVANELGVEALVTGESVAQVSSQTLANLSVIDQACDCLVLRPLITMDKVDIIHTAAQIGTESFAAAMPEYCGVISVKPTTRAKPDRVEAQEARFDFAILEQAIQQARYTTIDELANEELEQVAVEILPVPLPGAIILDVRHPDEAERQPLHIANSEVRSMPFYELHSRFDQLSRENTYLLYCDRGVMSRLHAAHLVEQGYHNVKVYRPGG